MQIFGDTRGKRQLLCRAGKGGLAIRRCRRQSGQQAVVDERQKSQFENRKRNLKTISPISRGEREIWIPFPQFREKKEKFENYFSHFERRKRNRNSLSPVSRREREFLKQFLPFREEKEKVEFPFPSFEKRRRNQTKFSQLSRREREILITFLQFR